MSETRDVRSPHELRPSFETHVVGSNSGDASHHAQAPGSPYLAPMYPSYRPHVNGAHYAHIIPCT